MKTLKALLVANPLFALFSAHPTAARKKGVPIRTNVSRI